MRKLEVFLHEHQIYAEQLHANEENRLFTLLVQFDDTERRVEECGAIISKSGFANLMRKFPENKWTMANYTYKPEEKSATITFIPHDFLVELIDTTSVLAHRLGLQGVRNHNESLDAVIAELISMNEKYEQCYYSMLVVDEDLLDALRNDGELLTVYLENNGNMHDQPVLCEHHSALIKQLDELSFYF